MNKVSNTVILLALMTCFSSTLANSTVLTLGDKIKQIKAQQPVDKVSPALRQYAKKNVLPALIPQSQFNKAKAASAMVTVDAVAVKDGRALLAALSKLGLQQGKVYQRMVSGRLPLASIDAASALDSLHYLTLHRSITHTGSVTSEGVQAMRSDTASTTFSVDGSGIKVGVISDSYDCYAQSSDPEFVARAAANDKANGDLPANAYALEEINDCTFATDEGRALMHVVHDVAPGAELVFLSGSNGVASIVDGMIRLVDEVGVDLIVDDSFSTLETYFQDGPIAQAINYVNSQGVTYVTSTGNSGRLAYQSAYNEVFDRNLNLNAHDFDPGPGVDILQAFSLPAGESIDIQLQWADPAYSVSGPPGAATDLDIFIVNAAGTDILVDATRINLGQDPAEAIQFFNPEGATETQFNLLISKAAGPAPSLFKYLLLGRFNGSIEDEYATHSGTVVGRSNTAFSLSVGAADYSQTPAFGAASPVLQNFSSAGGDTPILFDKQGQPLATPVLRQKPDIVGPDDVNNPFFLFSRDDIDSDNDGLPNFIGTSASAPHIAGVVALLLEMNPNFQPQDIQAILQATAIDMTLRNTALNANNQIAIASGFDADSGAGFVDAQAALSFAATYTASAEPPLQATSDINRFQTSSSNGGAGMVSLYLLLIILFCLTANAFRVYRR